MSKEGIKWVENDKQATKNQLLKEPRRIEYFTENQDTISQAMELAKTLPFANSSKGCSDELAELCNQAFAGACLKRIKSTTSLNCSAPEDEHDALKKNGNLGACLKRCESESSFKNNNLWIKQEVPSIDLIRMLPLRHMKAHLIRMMPLSHMRDGDLLKCTSLLSSIPFLSLRVEIMGIEDAASQHCLDCAEVLLYMKNVASQSPNESLLNSFKAMKNVLDACGNDSNAGLISKVLHSFATFFENVKMLDAAVVFYQFAIDYEKRVNDCNQRIIAQTLHHMGDLSEKMGKHDKALSYYKEIILMSHDNQYENIKAFQAIAKLNSVLGNYEKAKVACIKVVRFKQHLRLSYIEICQSYISLGRVYDLMKCFEGAYSSYQKVLKYMHKNRDKEHRYIGDMYFNLGRLLSEKEEYDDALHKYAKAFNFKRKYLGDDHIEVARVAHAIGKVYLSKLDYKSAISHYQLSLVMLKNHFGAHHPKTVRVMHAIAFAHHKLHQYDKALGVYNEIMQLLRLNPQVHSAEIAFTIHHMGISHAGKGDYANAVQYFEESLNIHEDSNNKKRKDSPGKYMVDDDDKALQTTNNVLCLNVTDILNNLGLSYAETGDVCKSIDYFEKLIDFFQHRESDGLEVAKAYQTLGDVLVKYNSLDRAASCYSHAHQIRKTNTNTRESSIHESNYFHSMGVIYLKKDQDEQAIYYFRKALNIRKQCLGENHEKVADTYLNTGQALKKFLLYDEALDCYKKSLSIYQSKFGLNHKKVADVLYNIAIVQATMGNYSHSLKVFEQVFLMYKDFKRSDNDPSLVNTVEWIAYLREQLFLRPLKFDKPIRRNSFN